MSRMLRSLILLGLFLALLLAPFVIRYLGHYRLFGGEDRPEIPVYEPAESVPVVATPSANLFADEPNGEGSGYVLLDMAHSNFLEDKDITYLDSRLSLRGYQMLRYAGGDLGTALRGVSALVVIAPTVRYEIDEIAAVRDFVNRGGRLLLVGDPTRFNVIYTEDLFSFSYTIENDDIALNSLGNEFDINFTGDYLYNTVENEGNFRNILIDSEQMGEHALTEDLDQLAFYGAHSLTVGRGGSVLLMGGDNTATSSTDRPGGLALAVLSADGNVLALGDVDFLSAPYYTSLDNSEFVARIADFLVETDSRRFVIEDFPFFYEGTVDLVYAGTPDLGPDAFDEIILLQDTFDGVDIDLTLAAAAADDHDALYLGLYNQATDLADILSDAGITLAIDPPIETADTIGEGTPTPTPTAEEEDEEDKSIRQIQSTFGNVQMSGTALILLEEKGNQQRVIVLAASLEGLENTIDRLLSLAPRNGDDALADCLVQDNIALCPSGVADEVVEAELNTGGLAEPIAIDGGDDGGPSGDVDELGAIRQGTIGLGESVEGDMAQDESHSWVFNDGPAVIDITLQGDDLDGVLELYDSNYDLLESMDSTFTGEAEVLFAIDIPDDDDYTIVVRDYFGDPADYTLSVEESSGEAGGSGEASIFIFVDDDGTPSAGGITSGETLADFLSLQYAVTLWTTTIDGPLTEEQLIGYNVIFWDSGDYRTEDIFLDEDTLTLLNYAFTNGVSVVAFGSTPPLVELSVETVELVSLSDIELVGTEPILTDGLSVGDVYALDQTYDVINISPDDLDAETDMVIFEGGPDSPDVGTVSVALQEDVTLFFLMAPFNALPGDLQLILLTNVMAWMGF